MIPKMRRKVVVPTSQEASPSSFPPLKLVELSDSNKLKLLKTSITESRKAVPQTQEMLTRLEQFHPSTARDLHLKGTAISKAPLRLLYECSEHKWGKPTPRINSYIALSYCWHGADWKIANALGQPEMAWPISTTMVHGLLKQRKSPKEGIWIDRYCINQRDDLDKQLAVGSMDLFYKSARKTVVVLEDVSIAESDEVAFRDFLEGSEPQPKHLDILSRILIRILSARWFRRAWCSHELQLSKELVFLVLAHHTLVEFSPNDLERLYSETSDYLVKHDDLVKLMVDDIYMSYDILTRIVSRTNQENPGRSLNSEFTDIHRLACSSQTDIFCIAMNISGLQVYFTGQMRSANHCRWVLAMVALSAGDATVLGGIDDVLVAEDHAKQPSWLNLANDLEDSMTDVGASKLREPACITFIDQYQITLDLLDFSNCVLKYSSKCVYEGACFLLQLLSESYSNDEPLDSPFWMRPDLTLAEERRERLFVAEILACSFECGLDWMMRQIPSVPGLAKKLRGVWGDFESRFWPMLTGNIPLQGSPGMSCLEKLDNERKTSLLLYLYFVLFYQPLDVGSTPPSFTSGRSMIGHEDDNQVLVRCLWLDMGSNSKALLALRPGRLGPGRLSMPVALSNSSCGAIRRLWYLESCGGNEDRAWRLAEKFYMFTLMPIEENAAVIKSERQVIRQAK